MCYNTIKGGFIMHSKMTLERPDSKKLYLLLMLVALFILGTGCSSISQNEPSPAPDASYTVTFVNVSEKPISEIHFQQNHSGGGSMNADGSPIKRGERLLFDFDNPDSSAVFSVFDEEKNVLAAETVKFRFNEE